MIHWPLKLKKGASFPPREEDILPLDLRSTWEALEECVHKGLIKAIGVSNFNVAILKDVMSFAKIPPSVNQVYLMFVLSFSSCSCCTTVSHIIIVVDNLATVCGCDHNLVVFFTKCSHHHNGGHLEIWLTYHSFPLMLGPCQNVCGHRVTTNIRRYTHNSDPNRKLHCLTHLQVLECGTISPESET